MSLAPAKPLEAVLEREWDAQLFKGGRSPGLAPLLGWQLCYHTLRSKGSRAGFPDRVLVRERIVYAELKREKSVATPIGSEQRRWLDALARARGECYLWRPSDLDEVASILSKRWEFEWGASPGLRIADRDTETLWLPNSMWIPGIGRADEARVWPA